MYKFKSHIFKIIIYSIYYILTICDWLLFLDKSIIDRVSNVENFDKRCLVGGFGGMCATVVTVVCLLVILQGTPDGSVGFCDGSNVLLVMIFSGMSSSDFFDGLVPPKDFGIVLNRSAT